MLGIKLKALNPKYKPNQISKNCGHWAVIRLSACVKEKIWAGLGRVGFDTFLT
jgi:hypothetical protein